MKKKSDKTNLVLSANKAVPQSGAKKEKINLPLTLKQKPVSNILSSANNLSGSQQILGALFNFIDTGVFVTDYEENIADVNETCCKIYGYSKEELIGNNCNMLLPDEPGTAVPRVKNTPQSNDATIHEERQARHKDGSILYIKSSTKQLLHTNGKKYKITSVTDITEHTIISTGLQQSENKYRSIYENSLSAFFFTNPNGQIIEANEAAVKMFGYSVEEFKQLGRGGIFDTTDPNYLRLLKQREIDGKVKGSFTGIRKNGEYFPCELSSVLFKDTNDEIRSYVILIDVSERIKAELENSLLLDNTEENFVVVDKDFKISSFNKHFQKGYKEIFGKDIIHGNSILDYMFPDRIENLKTILKKVFAGEKAKSEIDIPLSNGEVITIETCFKPIRDQKGHIYAVFINSSDITEKKKVEKQFINSERRFKTLIENGHDVVTVLSSQAKSLYISASVNSILGYTKAAFTSKGIFSLVHPDDLNELTQHWQKILRTPATKIQSKFCRLLHEDGSYLWIEYTITNMLDDASIEGLVLNFRDISEKVAATEKIRQSEENLKAIFDNTDEGFALIDSNFIVKASNANGRQNNFMMNAFQVGDNLMDFIEGPRKEIFKTLIEKALSGESVHYERPATHVETNEPLWLSFSVNPVQVDGKIESVCITGRDNTERKKKDLKIAETKNLLKRAESIAHIGSIEVDYLTNRRIWSDEFFRILGLEPGAIEPSSEGFIQFLHPDDKQFYLDTLNKKLNKKNSGGQIETRIIRADGIEINILAYAQAEYNEKGKLIKMLGVIQDVTEQKKIERKIAQTQQLLNSAEKIAGIGSAEINLTTGKRIWSDQFYSIVGLEPGITSPTADGIVQFLHPDEKAPYLKWLQNGLTNKIKAQQIESRIIRADGEIRDIMAYGTARYDANGKAETVIGVIQDITDLKKLEQELAVNKDIYQSLFYQNPAAVFSLDMEGHLTSSNHILSLKSGCSEAELLQMHYSSFVHPEDLNETNQHFENTKLGISQEYEIRIITPNGTLLYVSLINLPIIINKSITGVYCIANDITKEKEARLLLNNTLADRQRILDYSLDVICEFDSKGNFLQVSKACKDLWDYYAEELIGKSFMDMVFEEDKVLSYQKVQDIITTGIPTRNFENRYCRKDGSIVTVIWSARWDADTNILYCIARDGSETKAQEKALGLSEQLYRNLFNNNPLPLFIFDFLTQRIIEVNEAALKKYGYSRNEFLLLILKDLLPKSEISKMNEMLKDENTFKNAADRTWIHKKKNGEIMHMSTTGNMIDYKGRRCVLSLLNDVTEKIKAESQKEFERRDKEALINTTDDQIWSVTKDFKFIAGNHAFIKSVELKTGKIIKQGNYLLSKENYSTEFLLFWHEMYYRALSGETFKREIISKETFANNQQWKEVSFKPIYNGKEISGIACYCRDITENKLYQNQLITLNKKLETAQQTAGLGYWEIDLQNNSVFFSDELYHIHGFTKTNSPISFQQISDAIHPDDKEFVKQQYTLTIEEKQPYNYEHRIIVKDGSIKVLLQKGNLVYDEQGIAIALEGTSQDITFRKKAEKAVKESEEKYRMIFNCNPLPNWIYDLETLQILEVNDAAITHYGYNKNEFLNMSIKDIFVLEEIDQIVKLNKNIKSYGLLNFGQWQHIKKSNKKINVAITGHTIQYNNKNAVMMVANDITEIMQTQQALAKSTERFEYATRATSDAIWDYDLTNNTIYWGEGFNTLFGYKMRERKPGLDSWEAFIHPDDSEKILRSISEIINDTKEVYWKGEYRFRKFDGSYTSVADSALVLRDNNGAPYRIIGAIQDISERIQKEVILKELNNLLNKRAEELATSNAELEQFAYIASHDLQEPLRMVTGFLTQIQKKYEHQLDEAGQVYIRFAVDGAVRMRKIILDLLEYSRVGRQQHQLEKINTQEMLKEAFRMYTNIITEKKIVVSYGSVPDIIGAKIPIQQLFQNLISNAIKYQQPGSIPEIKITAIDKEDYWQFAVADNGIGIDTEYFNKVFVIFQRLHSKDEYSGTGIGLAICKKIIDNHHGKIWVESTLGKGSTFYFTIPKTVLIY